MTVIPFAQSRLGRGFVFLSPLVLVLALTAGCPQNGGSDNSNSNGNTAPSDVSAEILSIQMDTPVSELEQPISIFYSVTGTPSKVDAYYQRLADSSPGAGQIGDDIPAATDLPVGSNLAFAVDPATLEVGYYRLILRVSTSGSTFDEPSGGILEIQGAPNPVFRQPAESFSVVDKGDSVFIQWDNGDPEGVVQWRLFILNEMNSTTDPPDRLGTQLATGSGNVGSYTLPTSNLAPGTYQIGVSATDSGRSVATTVADGESYRIVTKMGVFIEVTDPQTNRVPPTLVFTAPGSTDLVLFRNEPYTIQFAGTVLEPGATGTMEIFYDSDNVYTNGFHSIATDVPTSTQSIALPIEQIPEGTYYIGGTIADGVNELVISYAVGKITVVKTPTLTVLTPNTPVSIAPSTPGGVTNTTDVTWDTNVPPDEGMVDVYAIKVGGSGAETQVLPPSSTTVKTAPFSSTTAGVFEIYVRIRLNDGTALVQKAPQDVRVSSLPTVVWVGELGKTTPKFEGAIFQGVNFEDNTGSAFTTAGDLNDDGKDEIVIAARYGKPEFTNPSGVGPGEAYLVFGAARTTLKGEFNLNSIGTTILPGVTFAGIRTSTGTNSCDDDPSDETDGLSDLTMIPDADGDDHPDLVFGFPFVNSRGWCRNQQNDVLHGLDARGQFESGGVVILSSNNSKLKDPKAEDPTIYLDEVGQNFAVPGGDVVVYPDQVAIASPVVDDLCKPKERPEDPDSPVCEGGCTAGMNDLNDVVTGPSIGFIRQLATPPHEVLALINDVCALGPPLPLASYLEPPCSNVLGGTEPGSGYFADTLVPAEPRGARIIGKSAGDKFGTSLTFSRASTNPDHAGDLIISAPNRTGTTGEITGIASDSSNSGVAYLAANRNLWNIDNVFGEGLIPPRPHQYVIDRVSHCGDNRAPFVDALHVVGDQSDSIRNIIGIDDYNSDGRNDFAVGAPQSGGGAGRVYVAFRRAATVEGDFVLPKLQLDPGSSTNPQGDPERLDGVLVTSDVPAAFGSSLATGMDFNQDGISDLVVGSPNASAGIGEVIIIFGDKNFRSPVGGISVTNLLKARNAAGKPRAVRITGNPLDTTGNFGFNVANGGDIDGDGKNDLLVAAPNASPRFDPDPLDGVDALTALGVDADEDGVKDDVSGPTGVPDGCPGVTGCDDSYDNLTNAGLVYVLSSRNRLNELPADSTGIISVSVNQLGSSKLRGLIIAGRRAGDRLGGGDAGNVAQGGSNNKLNRGRSFGLASAGDVDGDGRADILIGSILADPGTDPNTGIGRTNAGEAYLIYGVAAP